MMNDLTHLQQRTIQMEYVVPLIKDLQEVLGEQVVLGALEKVAQLRLSRAEKQQDLALEDMEATLESFAAGDALQYEVIATSEAVFDFDVTSCQYAEMMERLGGREFGHLLICNTDYQLAKSWGLELNRSQTCMQGAESCDFRFRPGAED